MGSETISTVLYERYEALRVVTERLRQLAELGPLPTPERTELRHQRARLFAELGQLELAVREYTRCLLADPHNTTYHAERAALRRQLDANP